MTKVRDHQDVAANFVPSQITLDQASLQYPVTLARRLFSSVPRREFAVHNVSCHFSSEIVLLQGASSSGKSALMKLVAGRETPTDNGSVKVGVVVASEDDPKELPITMLASPIFLADKPPYNNQQNAQTLLQQQADDILYKMENTPTDVSAISMTLVKTICNLVNLSPTVLSQTPAQLSPSENYRIQLALACLQSSLPGLVLQHHAQNDDNGNRNSDYEYQLPAPILLLDEWMDFEAGDSSSKVEDALMFLVQETGAVVLCATHKPHLWKKLTQCTPWTSQVTMNRGKILTLRPKQQPQ